MFYYYSFEIKWIYMHVLNDNLNTLATALRVPVSNTLFISRNLIISLSAMRIIFSTELPLLLEIISDVNDTNNWNVFKTNYQEKRVIILLKYDLATRCWKLENECEIQTISIFLISYLKSYIQIFSTRWNFSTSVFCIFC